MQHNSNQIKQLMTAWVDQVEFQFEMDVTLEDLEIHYV